MQIYEDIITLQKRNQTFIFITVVAKEGHGPQIPGAKMIVTKEGRFSGTIGGGALEFLAVKESITMLSENKTSALKQYILGEDNSVLDAVKTGMTCGGNITLFFEANNSRENVYIFGGGHVGQAIASHFKDLNFKVTVIDCREEYKSYCEGLADEIIIEDYNTVFGSFSVQPNSFFIIATHSHEMDFIVMRKICSSDWNPKYIGAIASKKKSESVTKRLSSELAGKNIPWDKIYCPIGLKIGGTTPHEIAISIIAEIQAVQFGKEEIFHARSDYKTIINS